MTTDERLGSGETPPGDPAGFGWRVALTTGIVLLVAALAAALWLALDILLLIFAAILVATLLRAPTNALHDHLGVPAGLALTLVLIGGVALLFGILWLLAPEISEQLPELLANLASAIRALERRLGVTAWVEALADGTDVTTLLPPAENLVVGATGVLTSTFGVVASLVIIAVLGLYLAATPTLYLDGVTQLVPRSKQARVRETMLTIGHTLRWWMIGQLVSMTVVGTLTYLGLMLLGIPLALVLGVLAFLFTFIPFIGPILAAVPVLLVGFSQGAEIGVYVLLWYTAIQMLEGYILTPLVQRRAVDLPPALTITAQVLFAVLIGAMGMVLATPLAAAALVTVKMLYVEDVLGEDPEAGPSHAHDPPDEERAAAE